MEAKFNLKVTAGGIRGPRGSGRSRGNARGVMSAEEFRQKVKHNSGFRLKGDTLVTGIDAGAIDVAMEAARYGSSSVTVVILQRRDEAPAIVEKAETAKEAGIRVIYGWGNPMIDVYTDGRVSGATFLRCEQAYDAEGGLNPVFDEGNTMAQYCDNLVFA